MNNTLARVCRRLLISNVSHQQTVRKQYSQSTGLIQESQANGLPDESSSKLLTRTLKFPTGYGMPREVWVENFDTIQEVKRGIVHLHPKIFACMPRLDVIHDNIHWQTLYRRVDTTHAKSRAECRGGGRKPRPQKGTGKSRQGSIRAPHYVRGGVCHGPRNPTTHFYMLPLQVRVCGLISTLSAKFAQDDIHVIDNLDIPTNDPQFILDLMEERGWGCSVLIVDKDDIMPENIVAATEDIGYVNLMPVYGLNVYSMLKHETLVLTLNAVNEIEDRLLTMLHTARDRILKKTNFKNFGIKYS